MFLAPDDLKHGLFLGESLSSGGRQLLPDYVLKVRGTDYEVIEIDDLV
jgi:hypothetical protein